MCGKGCFQNQDFMKKDEKQRGREAVNWQKRKCTTATSLYIAGSCLMLCKGLYSCILKQFALTCITQKYIMKMKYATSRHGPLQMSHFQTIILPIISTTMCPTISCDEVVGVYLHQAKSLVCSRISMHCLICLHKT